MEIRYRLNIVLKQILLPIWCTSLYNFLTKFLPLHKIIIRLSLLFILYHLLFFLPLLPNLIVKRLRLIIRERAITVFSICAFGWIREFSKASFLCVNFVDCSCENILNFCKLPTPVVSFNKGRRTLWFDSSWEQVDSKECRGAF